MVGVPEGGRLPFLVRDALLRAGQGAVMVRLVVYALFLLAQCGCGGGWAPADTKSATDAVHLEAMALSLCAPDGDACAPSQVRAIERACYCLNASQLARHGETVPDGGPQCQPP